MEKTNIFKSTVETINQNRKGFFRIWLIVAVVHIVSLFLGFAIFLIMIGIQFIMRRIIIYWIPARNWLARTFDLNYREYDSGKTSPIYRLFVNIFHFAITMLYIALGIYMIKLGIDILSRDGFLGQNFIYLIFFR